MTGAPPTSAWVEMRAGAYHDSVTLMRVSREVAAEAGVERAMVAMGTALNRELIAGLGFVVPDGAGPDDLVIAVRGGPAALAAARVRLEAALVPPPAPAAIGDMPPHTVGAAVRDGGTATLALVSVPGEHAFPEALDAVEGGADVLVFSDNMPVWQEVALKRAAARRGRLVMGPDCGTAVVGGAALGFANVTRPGPVGLVAASGTGAQQVMCLLDEAGVGVSHVLGVGGRDLSAEVGGLSTRTALGLLDADPATERILLIAKPHDPRVAATVRAHAGGLRTPVTYALLGTGSTNLTAATRDLLTDLGVPVPAWPVWPGPAQAARPGYVRGLFSGGTLCEEARTILGERADVLIDFGDDEWTRGRPHPMIDPTLRLERVAAEAAEPSCAVLLLDVVLGHGADPDPAATLAPAIASARTRAASDGRDLAVVVSLCATAADPQDRTATATRLAESGAHVFASNAEAAHHAASLIEPTP